MVGVIDFLLIIVLLILTTYAIIYKMTSVIDNKFDSLKNDFVNIKCEKNITNTKITKNNRVIQSIENYGSLPDNINNREENISQYIAGKSNQSTEELLQTVINDEDVSKIIDPNFNTYNNLPYLIDPQNSNEGYYYNRVKLITNPNSPLLKKANENMQKINIELKNCENNNLTNNRDISGYNNYENLSEDSYANVSSIGKSLLTPYTSYPLPS
jgi:hypothetical protein